ncbi:MarR family winged helix-turn-helix transcriptional regulator [Parasediminibacterium sp. JCM 36343]|uniref:MarR family winged helix-turn-helix transcriptional regulator n=1 Tax=Parasediminibacterium sp. JCM 36343 TaxID=3374279 RepID=UPI00397CD2A5
MKLEEAIKSTKFKSEVHKSILHILYTAWWLKTMNLKELKKFGLTGEQYNVLRILKGKHPEQMCVRDIASRMIEKSSNVPRIIDRLELKKWVLRNTSIVDKRETVITITKEGMAILEACTQLMEKKYEDRFTIKEEEALVLNALLERIREINL